MKNKVGIILNGLIKENPTFVLVLGMCPTLATTTSAINGIGMGLATAFVLIFSNMVISLIKNLVPDNVRIPSFIVVIATFVTIL
jgi:electron transport complex protein RnfE